ncbi:hypothetical protein ACX27_25560 [Nostoc piscinale CENA21]|uniref:DUF4335 domain-containing protein n=1 Tax=Nostoc piscinale CENA21 TaxID=224013 RepID=A0A0M4T7M2_9NOSO|nr:DUF4335 domain-containing protein [Nostoc piscinale]ALF55429.1 hypothetical protein ACX27_25560 [Nostoc piscinale CENA21]
MPVLNSVIRRYTPPTCTLEVLAQSSPLSRWMGKTVIKQLSFELRIDDPRLPEERRVVIRGDRDQLEALCDAVTSYVQQFLQQSPENFSLGFSGFSDVGTTSDDSAPSALSTQTLKSFTSDIPKSKIYLEPGSSLTHKLYLGSLSAQASSPLVQLSLLQLFDLASALDEYSADVMALPSLNNNNSVLRFPTWAPVAAVLVLSVGLLPITLQYANYYRQNQPTTAKKTTSQESDVALAPAPSANLSTPLPGLASPDNLPTLPPIDSTLPLPTSRLPAQPVIPPGAGISSANSTTSLGLPSTSAKTGLNIPQASISTKNNPPSTTSTIISGKSIALNPAPSITKSEITLPQRRSLPPRLSSGADNLPSTTIPSVVPPPLATIPNNNRGNNLSPEYSPTNQQLGEKISSSLPPSAADNNPFVDRLGDVPQTSTPSNVATNSTIFDTTQIAEARSFFQKRWQPPAGLTQTLEYSLTVDVDGSLARILPLNKPAREFIDNTGIPAIGKPFVSGNKSGQNIRIRVVFSPDGKVQTFSESE